MRALWVAALLAGLGAGFSGGQQAAPPVPPPQAPARLVCVKVYTVEQGVTAPELLPPEVPPFSAEDCQKKTDGHARLSFLVDATGKPRNIVILRSTGSEFARLALMTVEADRFNPGTHEGVPVVVAQWARLDLNACIEEKKDDGGNNADRLRLVSQPAQRFGYFLDPPEEAVLTPDDPSWEDFGSRDPHIERVGHGVSAPVLLKSVAPEFTDAARRAKYQGVCVISIIVDAHGKPQNRRVVRTLGMGLDKKAIKAVGKYRFKPAMKDGVPVPVKMNVEIDFHL